MPLSKEHKAKTRKRILDSAGKLFRRHGYDGVTVDAIMADAGLTRGGFYAHFASKQALFSEVLADSHDLIRRLAARPGETRSELFRSAAEIVGAYLDPANFGKVAPNCTFASLSSDASRSPSAGRDGFTLALKRFHDELERGMPVAADKEFDPLALRIIVHAIGAMTLARTSSDPDLANAILEEAQDQINEWHRLR